MYIVRPTNLEDWSDVVHPSERSYIDVGNWIAETEDKRQAGFGNTPIDALQQLLKCVERA